MDETHGAPLPAANDAGTDDDGEITIYIDRGAFRVTRRVVTGGELRTFATPAIGGEYELYHASPGNEPDRVVHDEEVVELEDGSQFFSAPKMIMAGDQPRGFPRAMRFYSLCRGSFFMTNVPTAHNPKTITATTPPATRSVSETRELL